MCLDYRIRHRSSAVTPQFAVCKILWFGCLFEVVGPELAGHLRTVPLENQQGDVVVFIQENLRGPQSRLYVGQLMESSKLIILCVIF